MGHPVAVKKMASQPCSWMIGNSIMLLTS